MLMAVRGRLSENYFTRKFIAQNIFDMKYRDLPYRRKMVWRID
jgi:hypothetical protein